MCNNITYYVYRFRHAPMLICMVGLPIIMLRHQIGQQIIYIVPKAIKWRMIDRPMYGDLNSLYIKTNKSSHVGHIMLQISQVHASEQTSFMGVCLQGSVQCQGYYFVQRVR